MSKVFYDPCKSRPVLLMQKPTCPSQPLSCKNPPVYVPNIQYPCKSPLAILLLPLCKSSSNICLKFFITPAKIHQLSSDPFLQKLSDICLKYFMTLGRVHWPSSTPLLAKAHWYMSEILHDQYKSPPTLLCPTHCKIPLIFV